MPSAKRKHKRRTDEQLLADLEAQVAILKDRIRDSGQFSPDDVAEDRERLGLSAAEYADLVGVFEGTIYSWERGRSTPRAAQMKQWLAVRGMPKAKAWKKLGLSGKNSARGIEFNPEELVADRERLEISAADYGDLVGVSQATIYAWEQGRTKPRPAQMQKWLAVRGMSKAKAWKKLGISDKSPLWGTGFSAKAVAADRARLELSAADYGELVGVSGLTIYNWEKGKTEPREPQIAKWLAVKGIGKREAWGQLGIE